MPQNFLIEKDGKVTHDMMLDEQMLISEDNNEIAIFLGCSHPELLTVFNMLRSLFRIKYQTSSSRDAS